MKQTALLFLAILVCPACQRASLPTEAVPSSAPSVANHARPTAASAHPVGPSLTAEEIFKTLTAHTWSTDQPGERRRREPGPDYRVTTFRADGTWSTEHITDYESPASIGKWTLELGGTDWFLCRDDGLRQRVVLNADGTLTLSLLRLYPDRPLQPDPQWSAATLPVVTLQPEVQRIIERLTAHGWKRANDLDLSREPTEIHFSRDWTYIATYRGGACTSRGTWYATAKEIGAHSPAGRCDDRQGTRGDQFAAKLIDDRRILVNQDLYVPEDEPVKRGIIWSLFGYDSVTAIRIEYDMPIRRGVPNRFDTTVTNAGRGPLTLERFSLTRSYSNYGRNAGDTGEDLVLPEEIAGKDLEGFELQPGESHKFTLSASLADEGAQGVYFNALIFGTTQNWDTHSLHEVTVRE